MTDFTSEARGIADRMAKRAVLNAVTSIASNSSFEVYKNEEGRDIRAEAIYGESRVEIVWTIGGDRVMFENAVKAIAERMASRLF